MRTRILLLLLACVVSLSAQTIYKDMKQMLIVWNVVNSIFTTRRVSRTFQLLSGFMVVV